MADWLIFTLVNERAQCKKKMHVGSLKLNHFYNNPFDWSVLPKRSSVRVRIALRVKLTMEKITDYLTKVIFFFINIQTN